MNQKITYTPFKIVVLTVSSLILFNTVSCNKEPDCSKYNRQAYSGNEHILVTEGRVEFGYQKRDTLIFGYTGNEEFEYIRTLPNLNKDTIKFKGTGEVLSFEYGFPAASIPLECVWQPLRRCESVTFVSSNPSVPDLKFILRGGSAGSDFRYEFGALSLESIVLAIGCTGCPDNVPELILEGISYYNVNHLHYSSSGNPMNAYLTANDQLLHFILDDSTTFTRIK